MTETKYVDDSVTSDVDDSLTSDVDDSFYDITLTV